eukprot:scaffold85027_cov69-Phaeocystis_antarctica.AAC.3
MAGPRAPREAEWPRLTAPRCRPGHPLALAKPARRHSGQALLEQALVSTWRGWPRLEAALRLLWRWRRGVPEGEWAGRGLWAAVCHMAGRQLSSSNEMRSLGRFLLAAATKAWLGLGLGLGLGFGFGFGLGLSKKDKAQTSASWLSGGLFRRQSTPQAAPSFGQPRPTSRLGRAGRPYRACFPHGRGRPRGHAGHARRAQRSRSSVEEIAIVIEVEIEIAVAIEVAARRASARGTRQSPRGVAASTR